MKLCFDEITVGSTMYDKWHEVKVLWKGTHINATNEVIPDVFVQYVNQSNASPVLRGDGNLTTEPVHCWSCKKQLIDNVYLNICPNCNRAVCTDSQCAKCHCGTEWDPNR